MGSISRAEHRGTGSDRRESDRRERAVREERWRETFSGTLRNAKSRHYRREKNSDARESSGASTILVPAKLWCQRSSGVREGSKSSLIGLLDWPKSDAENLNWIRKGTK